MGATTQAQPRDSGRSPSPHGNVSVRQACVSVWPGAGSAVCERSRSAGTGAAGQPVFAGGQTVGRDGRQHLTRRRGGDPDVSKRYTGVEGGRDQGVAGSRDPGLPPFTAGRGRPVDVTSRIPCIFRDDARPPTCGALARIASRGWNIALCLGWQMPTKIHASTRENVVIPTTSVEVMGVCSNPSWLADLGKCGVKV